MTLFICSQCNYGAASWIGKCPGCGEWNTLKEQIEEKKTSEMNSVKPAVFSSLSHYSTSQISRIPTTMFEFDRVLGGGFVPGEVCLLSGEPGIGKSTLLIQALKAISALYVSGEESAEQVHDRAKRLKVMVKNILFSDEDCVEKVLSGIEVLTKKPQLVIIDSIQTIYSLTTDSPPGSVTQIRNVTDTLLSYAKKNKIAFLIIGHVTKDGDIAGPKTLEHMVDCVLTLEGDPESLFRILRATKNRFGSTEEIGVFQMNENGMQPVDSALAFLENQNTPEIGKAVAGICEGKRPLFIEIQTLAVPTTLTIPRRVAKGIDYNRMMLLLAVAKKYLSLRLDSFDIYINVVGGLKITSPLADAAIIAALYSSIVSIPLSPKTMFCGEVGLLGEIRSSGWIKKIENEARRVGFSQLLLPSKTKTIQSIREAVQNKLIQ